MADVNDSNCRVTFTICVVVFWERSQESIPRLFAVDLSGQTQGRRTPAATFHGALSHSGTTRRWQIQNDSGRHRMQAGRCHIDGPASPDAGPSMCQRPASPCHPSTLCATVKRATLASDPCVPLVNKNWPHLPCLIVSGIRSCQNTIGVTADKCQCTSCETNGS